MERPIKLIASELVYFASRRYSSWLADIRPTMASDSGSLPFAATDAPRAHRPYPSRHGSPASGAIVRGNSPGQFTLGLYFGPFLPIGDGDAVQTENLTGSDHVVRRAFPTAKRNYHRPASKYKYNRPLDYTSLAVLGSTQLGRTYRNP
jgi:hypothetical protein